METFGDKLRAWALATVVHLVVAGMLFAGLLWTASKPKPIALQGPVIEAELVGMTAAPKPRSSPRPAPRPPAPKPEQPKPEPPTPPQRNDQLEREKVAELAQEKAEQARRAQEEKMRQEQVLLEQQERERLKQLEEIKRQRLAADKQAKLAAEKLKQLKDLQKQPVHEQVPEATEARTGTNGQDTSLEAEYFAAIQNAVTQNWLRPDNAQPGLRCMLRIVQIPGGDVIGVQIANPCNADPLTRNSIEQAVKRAAPLPYKGYEKVFQRDINFNFTYDG